MNIGYCLPNLVTCIYQVYIHINYVRTQIVLHIIFNVQIIIYLALSVEVSISRIHKIRSNYFRLIY